MKTIATYLLICGFDARLLCHFSGERGSIPHIDVQIRSLLCAGFNVSQLRALVRRIRDAQRNGVDSQGLTIEQIDDLLFKKRSMNNIRTLGVVQALLSGIHSKVREGEVARCIIDYVTMFDVPYGPWGSDGQVDVGTQHVIIEAKVDRVTDDQLRQIRDEINNDIMNPPNARGMRKFVILYAPNYSDSASASIRKAGGYVVKSCEQLREQIRRLGGP